MNEEKKNYYNNEYLVEIGDMQLKKMTEEKKFLLKNIYYDLDGHNIFNRIDRYNNKKIIFMVCFVYLTGFNLFEVIDSFVLYLGKYDSDSFNTANRIATLTSNMIYITFILILTTFTIVKMKIETCIYY